LDPLEKTPLGAVPKGKKHNKWRMILDIIECCMNDAFSKTTVSQPDVVKQGFDNFKPVAIALGLERLSDLLAWTKLLEFLEVVMPLAKDAGITTTRCKIFCLRALGGQRMLMIAMPHRASDEMKIIALPHQAPRERLSQGMLEHNKATAAMGVTGGATEATGPWTFTKLLYIDRATNDSVGLGMRGGLGSGPADAPRLTMAKTPPLALEILATTKGVLGGLGPGVGCTA
jgi:hypothetical protein